MIVHNKIGSTSRLIEVFEKVNKIKINETIIKRENRDGKYYSNPQYNSGQREVIELPIEIGKDLLRHPEYEFTLESTGGINKRVQLFFNGKFGDFLLIVEGDGRAYLAHIHEKDYLEIKKRYSSEEENVGGIDNNMGESVNSDAQRGVEYPITHMSDATFPLNQRLPSPTVSDATIRVNPNEWKAQFTQRWGEEGALVFDGQWWNVVGNEEFVNWKEGSTANKASWLDNERKQGRDVFLDGYKP